MTSSDYLRDQPRLQQPAPGPDQDPRQLTIHFAKASHLYSLEFREVIELANRYNISPEELIHDLLVTERYRQNLYVEKYGEPLLSHVAKLREDGLPWTGPIINQKEKTAEPTKPLLRLVGGRDIENDEPLK